MFVLPTEIVEAEASAISYIEGLVHWLTDRTFWYQFVWLVPLSVWKLGQLPRPCFACGCRDCLAPRRIRCCGRQRWTSCV